MWPFTFPTIDELADLIESHIYAGQMDSDPSLFIYKAGRASGKKIGPTQAAKDTVRAAVGIAGARLDREGEAAITTARSEIARLAERAGEIDKVLPELEATAKDAEDEARQYDDKAGEVLKRRAEFERETAPTPPEADHSGGAADAEVRQGPVDLNNALERKRKRAEAKAAAAHVAEERRLKEAARQRELTKIDNEVQRLIAEADTHRAEAGAKRDEIDRLKQEKAQGIVRRRELDESIARVPVDASRRWSEMTTVGTMFWSRFCEGYNRDAARKGAEPSQLVSADIDFEAPAGLRPAHAGGVGH